MPKQRTSKAKIIRDGKSKRTPAYTPSSDLTGFHSVAEAIALLLHPHAEVVLHDMVDDRIAGIWNAFSHRQVGDRSNLLNDAALRTAETVIGPYEKAERDGSRIKSVSASLCDANGNRTGFLCINLDMSKFDIAIEMLRAFANNAAAMPDVLFKGDLREQINLILRDELIRLNKAVSTMTNEDRRQVVRRLDDANIFQARGAVPLVSATLGVGRTNLYHILRDVRAGVDEPPSSKRSTT